MNIKCAVHFYNDNFIARNPNISIPFELKSEYYSVAYEAALISKSEKVLNLCSQNIWPSIRMKVIENECCPPNILSKMATDESKSVRQAVAENKKTSIEILKNLLMDSNHLVRSKAEITLGNIIK